jgi:hypothetical protein
MMFDPSTSTASQGAVRLDDWGLIAASGADAADFLHKQLTQDILGLGAADAKLAGYCSAKGRLLASFVVWRPADDEVRLACSADLLGPTLKRLSMFVLRAKCKLADTSEQFAIFGLAGGAATAWLGAGAPARPWTRAARDAADVIRLPDAAGHARYLLVQPAAAAAPDLGAITADAWRWLEVQSGVPRITAATVEQFVPQMVNFELVGGVNFQKGCYPGQEVVARSQYRGTLKRRMFVARGAELPAPGAEVFHSADPGQPAGLVVLSAAAPGGGFAAQVELKLALQEAPGELRAGNAGLTLDALPYAIPAEAA